MPVFLVPFIIPMLAGGTGFVLGSWTSDLLGNLFKLALAAGAAFLIYKGINL